MELLQIISDHVAIFLVALVVSLAALLFFANKFMRSDSAQGASERNSFDQSPAAVAFRKQLKEINLDLDKN